MPPRPPIGPRSAELHPAPRFRGGDGEPAPAHDPEPRRSLKDRRDGTRRIATVMFLGLLLHAATALHDAPMWRASAAGNLQSEIADLSTAYGTVVYDEADRSEAERVAELLGPAYAAVSATLGAAPPVALRIRLAPRRVTEGVMLGTPPGGPPADPETTAGRALLERSRTRREVVRLAWRPDDATADPEDGEARLAAALRYELAHVTLASLADGALPPLLQESLASALLAPAPSEASAIAQLRADLEADRLPRWSELMAPGATYGDPQIVVAVTRAIGRFLLDRWGPSSFGRIARTAAQTADWRSALASATGVSVVELEEMWLGWLPTYVDGRWRVHDLFDASLSLPERLLAEGAHERATHLLRAVAALHPEVDVRARADELEERAEAAQRASTRMARARQRLAAGAYDEAAEDAGLALTSARRADLPELIDEAESLDAATRLARSAARSVRDARNRLPWRPVSAGVLARQAMSTFAQLGHADAAADARFVALQANRMLAWPGALLLGAGLILAAVDVRRRTDGR